ncbi:hypothetical protein EHS13_25120 [Paenibacillus psychroresistens]|uniref:Uncharacterized protein n=1 Tax=Paenibacillus psychroresistens TaxID=1778678 RepID=A0A6B8RQX0_9BACL|nr:hypothetical protein [Paenibacillus psychroresistens]QGQ97935.1 hypothetical protein EHS13_25120 [Paenibacillus psychroresistens]
METLINCVERYVQPENDLICWKMPDISNKMANEINSWYVIHMVNTIQIYRDTEIPKHEDWEYGDLPEPVVTIWRW